MFYHLIVDIVIGEDRLQSPYPKFLSGVFEISNSIMPQPALPPVPPDIARITAPLLIGALINYGLYGVLCVQVYVYHLMFPDDKRLFKALVFWVFLLETIQVFLCAADIYYWFGSGYGNMIHLGNVYLTPFDTPLLGTVVSFSVQIYFCYRIWTLQKNSLWLVIPISCISTSVLYGGIAGSIHGYLGKELAHAHAHPEETYLWFIGNAISDLLIATTMSILLLQLRRQEHSRLTNNVIMRIVRLIMETNSLTASISVVTLILYIAANNTNYFICPTLFIGKLYSNTLLVLFNNRIFTASHCHNWHKYNGSTSDPSAPIANSRRSITLTPTQIHDESYKIRGLNGDNIFQMEHMVHAMPTSSTATSVV